MKCKTTVLLSDKFKFLADPVDWLADFSRRVVLKHHHHVLFRNCHAKYLQQQRNAHADIISV